VPSLTSRYAKESAKGLVIIGVTDEEPSIVDPWVKRVKPGYPMAILKPGSLESVLEVDGYPCEAVIDTEGKIAYSDGYGRTGSGGALSAAMKKAIKGSLWPKKVSKVADLITTGQLDKSYAELVKVLEGADEFTAEEKAAADKLQAFLEGAAVEAQADARALFDGGYILNALKRVEMFAKAKPPFPATEDCVKLLAEIEALPGLKAELKAGEQYLAAQDLERAGKFSDAFKAYKAIVKGAADTKMAAIARTDAESLIEKGLPGYESVCAECRDAEKACEKHAEKVKL
jgi:tetratricopeptide (TPR) repeat protein